MGNFVSESVVMTTGVPQGSHLGLLLFCVFIDDLEKHLNFTRILMYADDVKLYARVGSVRDAERIQSDLDALVEWSSRNGLRLNTSKCVVISFSRSRDPFRFDYSIDGSDLLL